MTLDAADMKNLVERKNKQELYKDKLIEKVEEFFKERSIPRDLGYTQFQDLLGKANMTTSVKEIVNFIQYQCGRDRKQNGWAHRNFGNDLIKKIEEVAGLERSDRELSMDLVRLFLGYLLRYARYLEQ